MRSIERKFKKIKSSNPYLGAYPCLVQAIKNKNYVRRSLLNAFKKLMPDDEYAKDEKKELVDYLEKMTKPSEEDEF